MVLPAGLQMKRSVAAGSSAQKEVAQKEAAKGLDAMLAAIQGAKKVGRRPPSLRTEIGCCCCWGPCLLVRT